MMLIRKLNKYIRINNLNFHFGKLEKGVKPKGNKMKK